MSDMVETMGLDVSVLGASWHGKENPLNGLQTAKDMCEHAGISWPVVQNDVIVNGQIVPGFKANVRGTDGTVLGFVSDVYQPIQNHEAFDFIDNIIGDGTAKFNSAGCLFNKYGRPTRIFISAELKPITVLGDQIANYLVFSHSHDGLNAVKVFVTPVRVVCHNTLTLATESIERKDKADKSPRRYWSTKHTGDVKAKLNAAQETLKLYEEYMTAFPVIAETMNAIIIPDEDVLKIMDVLFPDDGTAGKSRMSQNAGTMRTKILSNYNDPAGNAYKFHGTGWGLFQSITDVIEHIEPFRATSTANINREFKIIEGHPVTTRAQKIIMTMKESE